MNDLFDDKESKDAAQRERDLFAKLPSVIESAIQQSAHYGALYSHVDSSEVIDRQTLATLPITRKFHLPMQQKQHPPCGGINAVALGQLARVFQSPGPLYEGQSHEQDFWRTGRAFYAAGFRAGELVHNSFSYHFSPGGFIMDGGARACGCAVFPAGVGNTEAQLEAIHQLQPSGYTGTPSYLANLLEQYQCIYQVPISITKALVSGEAVTADMQALFDQHGVSVAQAYASAELGLIAYQVAGEMALVVAEDIIVEIVDPDGNPVEIGEVGEVVVTSFDEKFPLIRYATGDLSAQVDQDASSLHTNMRLKGWMGRADSAIKVKGLFIYPHQVQEICRRHAVRGSLLIDSDGLKDTITFYCHDNHVSAEDIQATLKSVTKLKGDVIFAPNEQEVPSLIEDRR
ncbi:AMP-dependent synthetase [Vibrio ponticus]|uniref:AMP-dependent synthetase n=1 Tax=Vibrio ponticus TaxID=265668 RepID=A0ABX3FGD5_9VIBR|nr:AMP-binding protein [Vibrio ponticus]OLQ89716.1 AMP-dependent synthetase [Vibrio ponticus]